MTLQDKIAFLESRGFSVVEESTTRYVKYYEHVEQVSVRVLSVYYRGERMNGLCPEIYGDKVVEHCFKMELLAN